MIKYLFLFFSSILLVGTFCGAQSANPNEPGSLLVSYQTGPKGERLNRVRFLLINTAHEEHMYPKGNAFLEDDEKLKRLVAIEELPPGDYTLKFLIPNTDGLFEEVPDKTIAIESGSSTAVDQTIKPRYVSFKAMTTIIPKENKPAIPPVLTLRDGAGNLVHQSTTGKMINHYLLPDTYTLTFEPIPGYSTPAPISFKALPGKGLGVLTGTYRWLGEATPAADPKEERNEVAIIGPLNAPIFIHQIHSQLTVTTNMPYAHWSLLRNNHLVFAGQGSVVNFQTPDGDNFRITAEEIEGYSARINPSYAFSLYPGQTMRAEIIYERTYGSISIDAPFPDGETVTITTTNLKTKNSKTFPVKSRYGKVYWLSPDFPTGTYQISYTLPQGYEPIQPQEIYIHPGERLRLAPALFISGTLTVTANISGAVFVVKSTVDGNVWEGEGKEFKFKGLPGGIYQVMFTSKNNEYYLPPQDIKVALSGKENKTIDVNYQVGGLVTIRSNMDRNEVLIEGITDSRNVYSDTIYEQKKSFTLPEGRYRVTLTPLQGTGIGSIAIKPPAPMEINVRPLTSQTIDMPYVVEQQQEKAITATVEVSANISAASFTVTHDINGTPETVGFFTGKDVELNLHPGKYRIIFSSVPNYTTPEPVELTLEPSSSQNVTVEYHTALSMLKVPAGSAIIGDARSTTEIANNNAVVVKLKAFTIGAYEVTNGQYAEWLNEALQKGTVAYVHEADNEGQVIDTQGRLLCKTFDADPFSQITTRRHHMGSISFAPLPGKEQFPVIDVTWYGAMAYCQGNNCRLPTEAEWEKAAGMAVASPTTPLKKFVYGFGRDDIGPSWANYKVEDLPITRFQVLTTPVGFFNGTNVLPLTAKDREQARTNLAKSPYGAYDMSGNVWEWVSDWYSDNYIVSIATDDPQGPQTGTMKVVKGGCYDSLAEGVRVSERLGLEPDHADAYTGFRVAL